MFPITEIPWWVNGVFAPLQPIMNSAGTIMVWGLVVAAVIVQVGTVLFGAYTIHEAIQKSE